MKTALSVVVMACLACMTIPKNSFSQMESKILNPAILSVSSLVLPVAKGATLNEDLNSRNRALKNFNKSNANATDVSWYKVSTGFIAHFSTPGVDTKIGYNKRGVWQYNLCTYMESGLPSNLRNMVRQQYYNYEILVCYTYETNGGTVYIIKMDDGKTLKTVKILNNEIIDTENYIRS